MVAASQATAVASAAMVDEYRTVGGRRSVGRLLQKGDAEATLSAIVRELTDATRMIEPTGEAPPCRDEKDRPYLHCAVASGADFLITFDEDLLVQGTIGSTRIVRPATFLAWFRARA